MFNETAGIGTRIIVNTSTIVSAGKNTKYRDSGKLSYANSVSKQVKTLLKSLSKCKNVTFTQTAHLKVRSVKVSCGISSVKGTLALKSVWSYLWGTPFHRP